VILVKQKKILLHVPQHKGYIVRSYIDVTPISPTSSQSTLSSPSPSRGPITRSMLKKIQLNFIQDGPNSHGLLTLFTWAKEDVKI